MLRPNSTVLTPMPLYNIKASEIPHLHSKSKIVIDLEWMGKVSKDSIWEFSFRREKKIIGKKKNQGIHKSI